jgi:hypothetical protein
MTTQTSPEVPPEVLAKSLGDRASMQEVLLHHCDRLDFLAGVLRRYGYTAEASIAEQLATRLSFQATALEGSR